MAEKTQKVKACTRNILKW